MKYFPLVLTFVFLAIQPSYAHEAHAQNTLASKTDPNLIAEALFIEVFETWKSRSPEFQTELGLKTHYGLWDTNTPEYKREGHSLNQSLLSRLTAIDSSKLTKENTLSYRLLEYDLKTTIDGYQWRYHEYPVNQMFGRHTAMVSILIDQHTIDKLEHAQAYIQRTMGIKRQIELLIAKISEQEKQGIIPPRFVFPHVIQASKNLISGAPFNNNGSDSTLLADFKTKVNTLSIDPSQKNDLIKKEYKALKQYFLPAYENLIEKLEKLSAKADDIPGVWKHPKGSEYYLTALRNTTTTDLTPKAIYDLGINEVARIQNEMTAIAKKVGFKGSLKEFFDFMETSTQFYYPNTKEGKQAYLKDTNHIISKIKGELPRLFNVLPKAELKVKQVEAYREQSAGIAFYQSPAIDGSRPGIYYANLFRMEDMPNYAMEALAYHEALPGHHMQIAIAQELDNIPDFRKYHYHTVYVEGWGLYSELIPKEVGFYKNPYADFGRLKLEIMRACRLVTDTGIHAFKWDKEKAVNYLTDNMPISRPDAVKAIERYSVMPSQATAYKIGMFEILRLREKSKKQLGDAFDIRSFHDTVLKNGSVPLFILEELVDEWIKEAQERG